MRASSDSSASALISGRSGGQLDGEQLDPLGLGQRAVVGMHTSPGQQLGDDLLVDVGVLPQVQPGEVKPEDVHRFP